MAMTPDSPLSTVTMDVETLVRHAWSGKIRVPSFQRDFRWHWEDVRLLFDSIVRGYPVGSLLLWVRGAERQQLRLGALEIAAPESREALWVVDGQQRITSLANALHEDGQQDARFALAYDLRKDRFIRPPKVENPHTIPLPILFDLQKLLLWFKNYPDNSAYLEKASGLTRLIRQFDIPTYQVHQADINDLRDIFDRMNNYGKRLSRAEIFSALNDEETIGGVDINQIAKNLAKDLKFGSIDGNTILQGVLARRSPNLSRNIHDEFTKTGDEGKEKAYQESEQAFRRAITFLQEEAGVPHFSLLAYKYLLPPLVRLFGRHPAPDRRSRQLLRRWYWRAAVAGPQQFKGGMGNAASMLCSRVQEDDLGASVQNLLAVVEQRNPVLPDLESFAPSHASTKIVLCSWWSMAPRSPDTLEPYEITDLSESLVDQPTAREATRYLTPQINKVYRASAANRLFMPILETAFTDAGKRLALEEVAGDEMWQLLLSSHSLNNEIMTALRAEEWGTALTKRHELLGAQLNDFLYRMCEWDFEDTPSLTELVLSDEEQQ